MSTALSDPKRAKEAKKALITRNKIVSDMNSALNDKYCEMTARLDAVMASGLRFYHWLGGEVNDVVKNVGNVYGAGAMKKIAEAWTMHPSMLYKSKAFNDAYSEEALERLCNLKTEAGTLIGWAHVIQLIGIPEKARPRIQDKVIDEAMTAKELAALVKKLYGQRASGGRPLMRPKTVKAGLVQLRTVSAQWLNRNSDIWNNQDHSLFQELEEMPPEELTHELVDELEQIAAGQSSMSSACASNAESAARLMDQVKSVLRERDQAIAAVIREERSPSEAAAPPATGTSPRATGRGMASGKAPRR
jgi:hypothetical protein